MSLTIQTYSSLEAKVEKAYASILSTLAAIQSNQAKKNIYLASVDFENEPDETQQAGDDSNKKIPNITLIAKCGAETPGNWGIREVQLTIEVTDNAVAKGSTGTTLDLLYEQAIQPLFVAEYMDGNGNTYNFPAWLSLQINQLPAGGNVFKCYGFKEGLRIESADTQKNGDLVTRNAVTNLICTELNS